MCCFLATLGTTVFVVAPGRRIETVTFPSNIEEEKDRFGGALATEGTVFVVLVLGCVVESVSCFVDGGTALSVVSCRS